MSILFFIYAEKPLLAEAKAM